MPKETKHCDKCSYVSEEGLVVSGCAYCGCHNAKPKQKVNFLQVGRITECGSCHPEKFEDCKEIEKRTENYTCDCVCHGSPIKVDSPAQPEDWEKEIWKWATKEFPMQHSDKFEKLFKIIYQLLNEAREKEKERIKDIELTLKLFDEHWTKEALKRWVNDLLDLLKSDL